MEKGIRISNEAWSQSNFHCTNCGFLQKAPHDDPDISPDVIDIEYSCDQCGMRWEVNYYIAEITVTRQPDHRVLTAFEAFGELLLQLLPDAAHITTPVSQEEWVQLLEGNKIPTMDAFERRITQIVEESKHAVSVR